ncbi:ABC transporter permease [Paenibacillus sepulcri]|uniref:ABC transporter permease n=1 Tax=Paenibacillus sepulcri TaxID=359917 RepID=A0ABS7C201_9BACL|nr:ABC transporter permease [Paenibacillus sepulcri]
MSNLIMAELFKLRKDRAFRMLVYLLLFIAAAYPIIIYIDNQSDGGVVHGADFFLESMAGNTYIIKFGTAILAGFFISSEYSTGVMKTIASSGSSRIRIFIAKLFGFTVGTLVISIIFPIVSTLITTVLSGFGELPAEAAAGYIPGTIGLMLLYAAAFAAIAALFATIFTDSGKTIGFLIFLFLMIDSILPGLGQYVHFLGTIYDYSVFKLLLEITKFHFGSGELLEILLVPVLTIAAFGLLGVLVYRRKEIK